jgi:hypothetical protein
MTLTLPAARAAMKSAEKSDKPERLRDSRHGDDYAIFNLESSLQNLASYSRPIVDLALPKCLAHGTAFLRFDAGDWTLRPEECRNFSRFSEAAKRFVPAGNSRRNAPTVRVRL